MFTKIVNQIFPPDFHSIQYIKMQETRLLATSLTDMELKSILDRLQQSLIHSDSVKDEIFSYFIESKIPSSLIKFLSIYPGLILMWLNVLLESVARNLDLLLSKNFLNEVFAAKLPLEDGDVLHLTVALMKVLARRITLNNCKLLYSQSRIDYPIISLAIHLESNSDPFIRAGIRSVLLQLLRLEYKPLTQTLLNERNYFALILGRVSRQFYRLQRSDEKLVILDFILEEVYYWNDLFKISQYVSDYLSNSIMDLLVLPVLIRAILDSTGFEQPSALFLLNMIVIQIQHNNLRSLVLDIVLQQSAKFIDLIQPHLSFDTNTQLSLTILHCIATSSDSIPLFPPHFIKVLLQIISSTQSSPQTLLSKRLAFEIISKLGVDDKIVPDIDNMIAREREILDTYRGKFPWLKSLLFYAHNENLQSQISKLAIQPECLIFNNSNTVPNESEIPVDLYMIVKSCSLLQKLQGQSESTCATILEVEAFTSESRDQKITCAITAERLNLLDNQKQLIDSFPIDDIEILKTSSNQTEIQAISIKRANGEKTSLLGWQGYQLTLSKNKMILAFASEQEQTNFSDTIIQLKSGSVHCH